MEVPLKATTILTMVFAVTLFMTVSAAAQAPSVDSLVGTWSGSWVPPGGVRDAITVEIKHEGGKLSGRFLTPSAMNFSKADFNSKTRTVVLEAADTAAGKHYKIEAKVQGTELTGSLTANEQRGELHLIKWTYVPRIGR
jgi:hypothetical protein